MKKLLVVLSLVLSSVIVNVQNSNAIVPFAKCISGEPLTEEEQAICDEATNAKLRNPDIPEICILGIDLDSTDQAMCDEKISLHNDYLVSQGYIAAYCFEEGPLPEEKQFLCNNSMIPLHCYDQGITSPEIEDECEILFNKAIDASNGYTNAIHNSDYDRIYKDESGIWYGVIDLHEVNLRNVFKKNNNNILIPDFMEQDFINVSVFDIKLTRGTDNLESITYNYTINDKCLIKMIVCVDHVDADTGTKTIFDKHTNGSFLDYYTQSDEIKISSDPNYDYTIHTDEERLYDEIDVVRFRYILTAEEVVTLQLDIQAQFDEEKAIIENNPLLTSEEKEVLIAELIAEYEDYEIEHGDVMESICVSNCHAEDEEAGGRDLFTFGSPSWLKTLLLAIIGAMAGGAFVYALAIFISKSVIHGTVGTLQGAAIIITRVGGYWGKSLYLGLVKFVATLGKGFKKVLGFK